MVLKMINKDIEVGLLGQRSRFVEQKRQFKGRLHAEV
jgi:hypothetical protein